MTEPFSPLSEEHKDLAKVALAQWLELCPILIETIKAKWKKKGLTAQYLVSDECIHINHIGGHGKIFRKGKSLRIHFPSSESLEEIEPDYKYFSHGKDFVGWQNDTIRLEDILTVLDIALADFFEVSEKLNAANIASIKLEDIQNGFSEFD
jgi:hypothetical protein